MRTANRIMDGLGWMTLAGFGFAIIFGSLFVTALLGVALGAILAIFAVAMLSRTLSQKHKPE